MRNGSMDISTATHHISTMRSTDLEIIVKISIQAHIGHFPFILSII